MRKPKILIAPLNWGLGHATRCMPIINLLLNKGVEVQIASDGRAFHLLKKEYPNLILHELPSYNIIYKGSNVYGNMFWQLPKIQLAIQREKIAVRKIVQQQNIDIIISDNRFGCRNSLTKNIFITHQLNILLPSATLTKTISMFNQKMIKAFDVCWIPDYESKNKYSGTLSVAKNLENLQFIGPLSRMKKLDIEKKNEVVVVLSGPEPQRTYLQDLIIRQAKSIDKKFLIIGGMTEQQENIEFANNITFKSFMQSEELNQVMSSADMIICRSGYSTIMDLGMLGKQAILIPTPGQPEQEYLATYFMEQGTFYASAQKDFDLAKALLESEKYIGIEEAYSEELLTQAISELIGEVN